ncbi:hypothetical protein [Mycolicibacterium hodleri]|uniref:Uncharacterized protein n=1 Tax=Mycolicibacterium hodleri TaxID=49897 RepID=A0A502E4E4_9MYCO|nr:hypothetical protein [Mycolicibacterium hodleri]TPG31426.1 hypothetical protein EAH80_23285 [Mycolicibacterium hodleri]
MTHFRTSATALEPDSQTLRAAQLITRPGALPTITIPMVGGRLPDVDGVWRYLQEAAEFFGIPMPPPTDVSTALSGCAGPDLVAASVTISDVDGVPRILVSSATVQPLRRDAVRIAGDESVPPAHDATDPWWRRMAARTTSKGELDQRERWLNRRGYADGLSCGQPLLGALVFETPDGVLGVENPEPTSVLEQLARCGAIAPIRRVPTLPNDTQHIWWVSPRYETHLVVELDGTRFAVDDEATPSFARWS